MPRFQEIDPLQCQFLEDGDYCAYLGEYTSGGGWVASETNRWIHNLHKHHGASPAELEYKRKSFGYWGRALASALEGHDLSDTSFVPFPCSKPKGHPAYDDRMDCVLAVVKRYIPELDTRSALVQVEVRDSQHLGPRASPDEIASCMRFDPTCLPLRRLVCVVDDVITRGASFAAAKRILLAQRGVERVAGIMLAKAVWSTPDWSELFSAE